MLLALALAINLFLWSSKVLCAPGDYDCLISCEHVDVHHEHHHKHCVVRAGAGAGDGECLM